MNILIIALSVMSIIFFGGCSKESPGGGSSTKQPTKSKDISHQTFKKLSAFSEKAPQDLLDDEDIGSAMKNVITYEHLACTKELFNYMPDLALKADGSLHSELTGSGSDKWREAALSILPNGEINLLLHCNFDNEEGLPFIYLTNRDVNGKPGKAILEWVETYFNAGGSPDVEFITSDGKNLRKRTYTEFIDQTDTKAKLASENKSNINGISSYSCSTSKPVERIINFNTVRLLVNEINLDKNDACNAIKAANEKLVETAKTTLNGMCKSADDLAEEYGGFDKAKARMESNGADRDYRPLYNLVVKCSPKNKSNFAQELASEIIVVPYSIGNFIDPAFLSDKKCIGILVEMKNKKSYGYHLVGTGSCLGFTSERIATDERKTDTAIPHGDIIRDRYKYDGLIPSTFFFNGQTRQFLSDGESSGRASGNSNLRSNTVKLPVPESRRTTTSGSFGQRYAYEAAAIISKGSHPACQQFATVLRGFGDSGHPDNVIVRQVDNMIDKPNVDICQY